MYGPPPSCKRKDELGSWSAPMYSALVESKTPGHDGHPLAFVPINWTVSNHFRNQVSKALDSLVLSPLVGIAIDDESYTFRQ